MSYFHIYNREESRTRGITMKRIVIWLGCILGSVILVPTMVVMVGGYYTPEMLHSLTRLDETYDEQVAKQAFNESIVRVLAKTVPVEYEDAALEAQAIIVRTYMMKRQTEATYQSALGELSMEQMKNLWKDDFEEIYERYMNAVIATDGQVITYQNELIEPIYHEASGGMTRKAKSVYGEDLPYLQAVASDETVIEKEMAFEKEEVFNQIKAAYPDLIGDPALIEQQIQIIAQDSSGYIESLQIGNTLITGEELAKIMGMPSSCFNIGYTSNKLIFYVRGIGSGVGLSQNGANEFAKQGKTSEEILQYYYTNVQITSNAVNDDK